MLKQIIVTFLFFFFLIQFTKAQPTTLIEVDLSQTEGPLKPVWAWFGYDEPNYTYMKDGKKLLSELAALSPVPIYVRAHNLLNTGDGTPALKWGSTNVYTEDKKGRPLYDWTIVDKIFDTYVERGMKPLAQIGFTPQALSTRPIPYKHNWAPNKPYHEIFTGWAYPPNNYQKWGELVFQWVKHCVERYGEAEVKSWRWEVWNEPNGYLQGTLEDYIKIYDFAADAVKRACPGALVGGPHTTGPANDQAANYLRGFLEHCISGKNSVTGKIGSPLDFVAFHAKGNPTVVDGHVRMNMSPQLNDIARGFEIVSSFPQIKHLPVIIGECDPEGCAACSMNYNPQNAYRNGTMYSSYTAASFARIYDLAELYKVNLEGVVSWSFEFEDQPWFHGFRDLATNGVDKPVLNVFRMYGMMPETRVRANNKNGITHEEIRKSGVHGDKIDIHAIASKSRGETAVMVWNYYDDNVGAPASEVELTIKGVKSSRALIHHYRIDSTHSNSYEVWKKMGSPQEVNDQQYIALERAGQLELLTSPYWIEIEKAEAKIKFTLPRQGVSLIKAIYKEE